MQLPEKFIKRINLDLGEDASLFFNSLDNETPVSIRANKLKKYNTEGLESIPWSDSGYYLPSRPIFTLDPVFHGGAYYVQEASSMFLEQVLKQAVDLTKPLKVLDLCAAPGGKSTHLLSLISEESLLVSNEVIRPRSKILSENLIKWGYPNYITTNNDPSAFQKLKGFFDVVIVDAPCSGEGLFRKDKESVNEWSEDNVNLCSARQKRIVSDVWDTLKQGGVLIYSTCTYNKAENEDNISWMINEMGATPLVMDFKEYPQVVKSSDLPGFHFYPHKTKGEGFFISAVEKTDGYTFKSGKIKKPLISKANNSILKEIKDWIKGYEEYEYWSFQEKVFAFPKNMSGELLSIIDNLSIINCGTEICEVKAKNIIPSHSLAISTIINKDNFEKEDLELQEALIYLKKEEIKPKSKAQYLLAQYNSTPIGWLKNAGNRYNNLYPKEWRIRMETR